CALPILACVRSLLVRGRRLPPSRSGGCGRSRSRFRFRRQACVPSGPHRLLARAVLDLGLQDDGEERRSDLPPVRNGPPTDCVHLRRVKSPQEDRKSTRLNSSHVKTSYAVFCFTKKTTPSALTASTGWTVALATGSVPSRVTFIHTTTRRQLAMAGFRRGGSPGGLSLPAAAVLW